MISTDERVRVHQRAPRIELDIGIVALCGISMNDCSLCFSFFEVLAILRCHLSCFVNQFISVEPSEFHVFDGISR